MNTLSLQAIKGGAIAGKLKINIVEPVNIFDICTKLGLSVRFVNVSMEGVYVSIEDAENATRPHFGANAATTKKSVHLCTRIGTPFIWTWFEDRWPHRRKRKGQLLR